MERPWSASLNSGLNNSKIFFFLYLQFRVIAWSNSDVLIFSQKYIFMVSTTVTQSHFFVSWYRTRVDTAHSLQSTDLTYPYQHFLGKIDASLANLLFLIYWKPLF